jgi:hypothetical protein
MVINESEKLNACDIYGKYIIKLAGSPETKQRILEEIEQSWK